jgi:hypothetical protein
MPFYSNVEIKSAPAGYKPAHVDHATGICHGPECCGVKMKDDGGCSDGCCDDYKCESCGHTVRIEWPD